MTATRPYRCLSAVTGASSSRVLNLLSISTSNANNSEENSKPLFISNIINSSLIIKHRLRGDELDVFANRRQSATKIVIPFDKADLRTGGQTFFVEQRGFDDLLSEVGNYANSSDLERDKKVLVLLDRVPSLDPFLLREYLASHQVTADECYFAISPADQKRMFDYAAAEIGCLTELANSGGRLNASAGRMVAALLSNEVSDKLEPLRITLNLQAEEFSEGVFSWRGFIYYKWSMNEFWPNLMRALRHIKAIQPIGKVLSDEQIILAENKRFILQGASQYVRDIRRIIGIYDDAYASLIKQKNPRLFRGFLLNAPSLFLEIGEKMGCLSHITSFWNYRFPDDRPVQIDAPELISLFQDFARGFGQDVSSPPGLKKNGGVYQTLAFV
jgi:hypothetical protein